MWEFEVLIKSREQREIIFGYNLKDACRRSKLDLSEISHVYHQDFID